MAEFAYIAEQAGLTKNVLYLHLIYLSAFLDRKVLKGIFRIFTLGSYHSMLVRTENVSMTYLGCLNACRHFL